MIEGSSQEGDDWNRGGSKECETPKDVSMEEIGEYGIGIFFSDEFTKSKNTEDIKKPSTVDQSDRDAFFGKKRAEDLARKLNDMGADIILLGGDYGETTKTSLEFFKALPDLTARSGVFAVMGNHDLLGHKEEISEL